MYGPCRTSEARVDEWFVQYHRQEKGETPEEEEVEVAVGCCAPDTVSFHYVGPTEARALVRVLYPATAGEGKRCVGGREGRDGWCVDEHVYVIVYVRVPEKAMMVCTCACECVLACSIHMTRPLLTNVRIPPGLHPQCAGYEPRRLGNGWWRRSGRAMGRRWGGTHACRWRSHPCGNCCLRRSVCARCNLEGVIVTQSISVDKSAVVLSFSRCFKGGGVIGPSA